MARQLLKDALTVVPGLDTTSMAAVLASGSITSGIIDNTLNKRPKMKIEVEADMPAASTSTMYLYLLESIDGGTGFVTTENGNMRKIGAVTYNGITLVRKVFTVGDLPDHAQIHCINNDSVNGLGPNCQVSYQLVTDTDVTA